MILVITMEVFADSVEQVERALDAGGKIDVALERAGIEMDNFEVTHYTGTRGN